MQTLPSYSGIPPLYQFVTCSRYSIGGSLVRPAVVSMQFVEQCSGFMTVRQEASVCLCVVGVRVYIYSFVIVWCVYFMHQLVIHFIDVCSIVSIVRCRFTPAVELWIFGVYTLIVSCACFRSLFCCFSSLFLYYSSSLLLFSFSSVSSSFLYFMC